MTNTELLISEFEQAIKYGATHFDFMVGKCTGNGPSVIAALERRGYTVERIRRGSYRMTAKKVEPVAKPAAAAPATKTISVSPIELAIGDRVLTHGAIVEVVHIKESLCDIPGGIRVAACTARLVGEGHGSIPLSWFDTPQSLSRRGCAWAKDLPDGHYWNVQGNAHASVCKVVA